MMGKRVARLDDIDVRLLELLQVDAGRPAHVLGRAVGISTSSVQRRIASLRRAGVVQRTVALVDPERVGRPLFLVVQVWLEREDVRSVNEFKQRMKATAEVNQCYHVTGDHTFMLLVCLSNMDDFAPFAERVFSGSPIVKKFCTSAVIARVKTFGAIPVLQNE